MDDKILGINAIRNLLGVSESTVMDMIHHQGLPAEKVKGQWKIKAKDLEIWQNPELSERKRKADAKVDAKADKKAEKKSAKDKK